MRSDGRRRRGNVVHAPNPLPQEDITPGRPYVVLLSAKFIFLGLLSAMILAFSVGRAARIILIDRPRQDLLDPHDQSTLRNRPDYHEGIPLGEKKPALPPISRHDRVIPKTVYTSKNFEGGTTSSFPNRRTPKDGEQRSLDVHASSDVCTAGEDGTMQCWRGKDPSYEREEDNIDTGNEEEQVHEPSGQHLLVDLKNVDFAFLDSEHRLASAVTQLIKEQSLTLLSSHCHSFEPAGVSCVAVILESHVSLHTWPVEGVITMDLFTCGSAPLLPVMPIVKRLFAIPQSSVKTEGVVQPVQIKWAHKLRGFRNHTGRANPLQTFDMGNHLLGELNMPIKNEVVSTETDYQRIDVYDAIFPRNQRASGYRRSLSGDGSYESRHPEYYHPDRIIYLDGIMQSRLRYDASYHEALVHPGMFAHRDPKRVAIIGGGEGATLREVLKHNTVNEVLMIEIDEKMMNISREYLKEWSDCSDLMGSSEWCGEDSSARLVYLDALEWFTSRYGNNSTAEPPINVIIVDALDPETDVPFAEALYSNVTFLKSLYDALSDDGLMVLQLGEAPTQSNPQESTSRFRNRAKLLSLLEAARFESIQMYEESHCGFGDPWSFAVVFKDYSSRTAWYANAAEVQLAIAKRIKETHSGKPGLRYFDGAVMESFQLPPKSYEVVFCRSQPVPSSCTLQMCLQIDRPNINASLFEVKQSLLGPNEGQGLFSKVNIPQGAYIGADGTAYNARICPSTLMLMTNMTRNIDSAAYRLKPLHAYYRHFGFWYNIHGARGVVVGSSKHLFINHVCNGTYNTGFPLAVNEKTDELADPRRADIFGLVEFYDPFFDRHLNFATNGGQIALRDIRAGEEIISNDLAFIGGVGDWTNDLKDLRYHQCSGGV